jgi:hypothetical protein
MLAWLKDAKRSLYFAVLWIANAIPGFTTNTCGNLQRGDLCVPAAPPH